MAKATTKTRVTAKHVAEHRAKAGRDMSPKWEGCETWDSNQFHRHFVSAMEWYRLEGDSKTFKPAILKWMESIGCTKEDISAFKKIRDSRINSTMGAVASCLNRGMTPQREDFNGGRDTAAWLRDAIVKAIEAGKDDADEEEAKAEVKSTAPIVSIQERVRDAAYAMTEEIEDALEAFAKDADSFDPKAFKLLNALRGKQAKAAHARVIKDFYIRQHDELVEVATTKDEDLKEAYSHLSKANLKKITLFYHEILAACDMLMQEAKVNKKPRAKKAVPADKLVAKLKYLKQDDKLKLVSINPTDIIGSKELWVYNVKTRKMGKYVAAEFADLGVKGTSITGFNENTSVQKTLRKPEDQIKEFKSAGKVQLRKFLEDIKAVDIKLNGRINEDTILLKVQ
jgi:hypothetical protein